MDPSSAPAPPPRAQLPLEKDHVNLRISYLVMGNPRPPHSLGNIHLNTTIHELKEKIHSELPEHPSLAEQRLIYQGRPLLRNEATLRDVLRLEPESGPLPHTIHIVIQNSQTASHPQPPSNPIINPSPPAAPHQHQNQQVDLNSPFRAAETSANRLQEQLARIQQQIETNRADLRSVQQRIALQHTNLGAPPAGPANANGQHFSHLPPTMFPINPPFGMPFDPQQQHMQRAPGRTPHHPRQPSNSTPISAPQHAATNGASTSNLAQQHVPGPHPPRVTVSTETRMFRFPMPRPASAPGQRPPASTQQQALPPFQTPQGNMPTAAPVLPPPGSLWSSQMNVPPIPLPGLFSQPRINLQQPLNTTAWLLSSPTGPQALLFAPGHGFFSSFSPGVAEQQQGSDVPTARPQTTVPNPLVAPQPQPADHQNQQGADRAVVQVQPAEALAQAQQNGQDNDFFAFIINRGWLFLRLYLFMFVFSEPGTWKRWIMIFVAAIVCLQPRDGPVTRLMAAARRHFDNLVGPPAQRPRPEAVAQQQGYAANQPGLAGPQNEIPTHRPASVRGGVQMTPEEAAARIVADRQSQQARPPRFWRDAFYRIEQSLALFLASLIPGVGERHVRAREEARREEQRREEERRRVEEEAAAAATAQSLARGDAQANVPDEPTPAAKPEVNLDEHGEQSTSSAFQARDEAARTGELRNRT